MWTVPNILTMIRILMIPVFVILFYVPADHWDFVWGKLSFHWIDFTAALIFSLSCLTDLADGFIARKYNLCSRFGAFLDPVADKLTVTTALVLIVERFCNSDILRGYTWLITIPAITIIGREIAITALREWMAEIGKRAGCRKLDREVEDHLPDGCNRRPHLGSKLGRRSGHDLPRDALSLYRGCPHLLVHVQVLCRSLKVFLHQIA